MLELAVRMAVNAANIGNEQYTVTEINNRAGLYEINFRTEQMTYQCYVDVMNGDVPGLESAPSADFRSAA